MKFSRTLRAQRRLLGVVLLGVVLATAGVILVLADRAPDRFGPSVPVEVGAQAAGAEFRAVSTPVIAIDPTNARRVVMANRVELPSFSCEVFASTDAGKNWRRSTVPLPKTGERCYAPSVVFRPDGHASLLLTMLEGSGNEPEGVFIFDSSDGGETFGSARQVLPASAYQTTLAVDRSGNLHLAWLAGTEFSRHATFGLGPPPNPISAAVSRDGGRSFSRSQALSPRDGSLTGAPAVTTGRDGAIYVAWWDYGTDVFDYYAFPGRYGGRVRLMLSTSRDSGRTFRRTTIEPAAVLGRPFLAYLPPPPAIAADPRTGALLAAWEDRRSGSVDVLLRVSRDLGRTWGPARELMTGKGDDLVPTLSTTAAGRVVAASYRVGRRERTDVVVRASTDAGRTFTGPAALTPKPFDAKQTARVPNRVEQPQFGSRLGLATGKAETFAAWVDTRRAVNDRPRADLNFGAVPETLPAPIPLRTARIPGRAEPSRTTLRLVGPCVSGPAVTSRRSSLAVVRSFVSAIDRGELRRAYSYFEPEWRRGTAPVSAPHPFDPFARRYRSLSCARLARADSYDRSEDGRWNTFRVWIAVRDANRPTRLMLANIWTHSDTARAPWSIIGFWTQVLARP